MKSLVLGLAFLSSLGSINSASAYDFKQVSGEIQISVDPDSIKYVAGQTDVLFVVDNSGSMDIYQQNFIANLDKLLQPLYGMDINAGVITTDSGAINWINTMDPDWIAILKKNLQVGVMGGNQEMPLQSIIDAITSTAKENTTFFRASSDLMIIMLTDAEDQSTVLTTDFLKQIGRFKNALSHVGIHGVIIPASQKNPSCYRDDYLTPVKLEEVIAKTKGVTVSLCDNDWAAGMTEIAEDVQRRVVAESERQFIELPLAPDFSTVTVNFGTMMLSQGDAELGWTFESVSNRIFMGTKIDWSKEPVGTRILINFKPAAWN